MQEGKGSFVVNDFNEIVFGFYIFFIYKNTILLFITDSKKKST